MLFRSRASYQASKTVCPFNSLTMPFSSIISALRAHTRSQRNNSFQANTEKLQWRLAELFVRTWDLGFTAFGGPPVHFQILHRRFVEGVGFSGGSKWIDEQTVSV
jgi:hypothetical protein